MKKSIVLLPNSQINREKWDKYIAGSSNRRIYATSMFLDIFSQRWKALVYGDGEVVMPVTWNRKFGISYVYQPIFVQQLGCFFRTRPDREVIEGFIDRLSSSYPFVDICLNEANSYSGNNFYSSEKANYLLEMDSSYEELSGAYSRNNRRNIIKAERLGLVMIPHYSPSQTVKMFILNSGKLYRNIRGVNYSRLSRLLENGLSSGVIKINAARAMNGNIIAVACFLQDYDRFVFYFSANSEEGKRQGAMAFLIDRFIRQYSGTGRIFDFNGSMNPDMARFYSGFGSAPVSYQRIKINRLFIPLRYLK